MNRSTERNVVEQTKDPRIDKYIADQADFARPILEHLAEIIRATVPQATETLKWGSPFWDYKGILCGFSAFKDHASLVIWKGDLIPELKPWYEANQGTGMGSLGKIRSLDDLPPDLEIAKILLIAVQLNEDNVKLPQRSKDRTAKVLDVPADFGAALERNESARAHFDAFTPSKRNEYVEWITEAKTETTREKRLLQAIEWIAEGKSRHWKYQNC